VATQLTIQGLAVRWLERLGQGATSSVWLGEWAGGGCVLKLGKGPAEAHRFADEAERLLFASAPEFPTLLGLGLAGPALGAELGLRVDAGTPYLVLSSAEGVSLAQLLSEPTLTPAKREAIAIHVAHDVGAALSALHGSGAAHGDVKPANVIVGADHARLVDFGLSGPAEQVEPNGGTTRYLAPEVFAHADGDARARDLWALGVTLLEILQPETASQNHRNFEVRVESALTLVVRALLAQAPGARPSASWVSRRAQAHLPGERTSKAERRRASVRRSYIGTRKNEIFAAARSKGTSLSLEGQAADWFAECREFAEGILKLRGLVPPRLLGPPCATWVNASYWFDCSSSPSNASQRASRWRQSNTQAFLHLCRAPAWRAARWTLR
jgi:serine/threonine protein kinase